MKAPIHDLHPGNLLTYGSLAAALAAVAVSSATGATAAGGWLALAALLDTFDGRFARCFERTSRQRRIGCEIDSLVDVCAFGMGPVVVLEAVSPPGSGLPETAWWASAFAYVGAVVTRLGFYNVEADDQRFVGLPAPAAALVLHVPDRTGSGVTLDRARVVRRVRSGDDRAACHPATGGARLGGVRRLGRLLDVVAPALNRWVRHAQRPGADSGARFGDPVTARGYRLGWIPAAGTCGLGVSWHVIATGRQRHSRHGQGQNLQDPSRGAAAWEQGRDSAIPRFAIPWSQPPACPSGRCGVNRGIPATGMAVNYAYPVVYRHSRADPARR